MKRFISTLTWKVKNVWYSFLLFFTFCLILALGMIPVRGNGQTTGYWKTIGDRDGDAKAIIEIYEQDHKLFGRVIKLLPAAKHSTCERCSGALKNKPIASMVILRDLTITNQGGDNGKVFDPSSGNTYNCYLELINQEKLKIRAYFVVPAIGRTQYWYRVQSDSVQAGQLDAPPLGMREDNHP